MKLSSLVLEVDSEESQNFVRQFINYYEHNLDKVDIFTLPYHELPYLQFARLFNLQLSKLFNKAKDYDFSTRYLKQGFDLYLEKYFSSIKENKKSDSIKILSHFLNIPKPFNGPNDFPYQAYCLGLFFEQEETKGIWSNLQMNQLQDHLLSPLFSHAAKCFYYAADHDNPEALVMLKVRLQTGYFDAKNALSLDHSKKEQSTQETLADYTELYLQKAVNYQHKDPANWELAISKVITHYQTYLFKKNSQQSQLLMGNLYYELAQCENIDSTAYKNACNEAKQY